MADFASFFVFDIGLFATAFVLLFAVEDAIGTVPIFLSISEAYPSHRRKMVRQAALISAAILAVFALFGWFIFDLYNITIDDFRIAGGTILFITSVDHLRGSESRSRGLEPTDIAAFPLATPLLAGPGAISTVVILSGPPYGPLISLMVIAGNSLITYLILDRSVAIRNILGPNGTNALSRLTALLIAALAVSFVVEGTTNIARSLH